ncbi:MAG: hypothetical protein R3F02_04230 [Thiolinea sp.]
MIRKVALTMMVALLASATTPSLAQEKKIIKKTKITEEEVTTVIVEPSRKPQEPRSLTDGAEEFIKLSDLLREYSYDDNPMLFQEYCNAYAVLAIRQAQNRLYDRCEDVISPEQGDLSRRWNLDPEPQYDWCLKVSSVRTGAEAKYRERRLNDCHED